MNNRHINEQLLIAATHGRLDAVKSALGAGAYIEARDRNTNTALHLAARQGSESCLLALIEAGSDINATNHSARSTALHLAVVEGKIACVRILLEKGANIKARNDFGSTALHIAAASGEEACLQALIEAGADLTALASDNYTALHSAASKGQASCFIQLLEAGVDIDAKDTRGRTALCTAAFHGHVNCLPLLLRYGADTRGIEKSILAPALAEMRNSVVILLVSATITRSHCLTNDDPPRVKDVVLDALALGLFEERIATRLIAQGPEGKALLHTVIDLLPERIKSLYAATLQSCVQQLQMPARTFTQLITDNPSQGKGR